MLRCFGVICIFLFALYIIFCYERYQRTRILQGEAFLLFMKFFIDEMDSYARPMAECLRGFRSEELVKVGFLPALLSGKTPLLAYQSLRSRLLLPMGLSPILESTFSTMGRGTRSQERRHLALQIKRAAALMTEEREAHPKRLRLCRTLVMASAMGLSILLL